MSGWSTPGDIRARAARRWTDGSLLRAYVRGEPCPGLDVPVRGPGPRDIGPELNAVRAWHRTLVEGGQGGRCYDLVLREVGGRAIGRMSLPARAVVSTYPQYWRLLGVTDDVRRLDQIVATTHAHHPELLGWVADHAIRAIEVSSEWPTLLAAYDWLAAEAGRGRYLREVTAPGVDTKFIERHAGVLDGLLGAWEFAPVGARSFAGRHGFREPDRPLVLRLDPGLGAFPGGIDEAALPMRHARALALAPATVLVIENQVSYLSAPVPAGGVVVWGHGFDALRLGGVPWIRAAGSVRYWGDLDTHGFAILSGLRSQLSAVRSVLMDRDTLLRHRDRWVSEPRPTRADLATLTPPERALYEDLVEGAFGPRIRLEQERIDWDYALAALGASVGA